MVAADNRRSALLSALEDRRRNLANEVSILQRESSCRTIRSASIPSHPSASTKLLWCSAKQQTEQACKNISTQHAELIAKAKGLQVATAEAIAHAQDRLHSSQAEIWQRAGLGSVLSSATIQGHRTQSMPAPPIKMVATAAYRSPRQRWSESWIGSPHRPVVTHLAEACHIPISPERVSKHGIIDCRDTIKFNSGSLTHWDSEAIPTRWIATSPKFPILDSKSSPAICQ